MQIIKLTGNRLNCATAYIPDDIINSSDLFWGYEAAGTLVAVAAVFSSKDEWGILWFYVLPEYRRKGYGNAFLEALVKKGQQAGVSIMTSVMEADIKDELYMELILSRMQFLLTWNTIKKMRVSMPQLEKAVFLTDSRYNRKIHGQARVKPLELVTSISLKKFIKKQEEEQNFMVSRADYSEADGKKSMALLANGDIVGIILLQKEEMADCFQISLCYVDKRYKPHVVALLKEAASAVLSDRDHIEALEFVCMDQSIVKLGKHIFPEYEILKNDIVVGECWL